MAANFQTFEETLERIASTGEISLEQATQLLHFIRSNRDSSHHHLTHSTLVYEANDEDYLEYLHDQEEKRKHAHKRSHRSKHSPA